MLKNIIKLGMASAFLMSTLAIASAQSTGTKSDKTGNQATGGSPNTQPDSNQKKSGGGTGG